MAAGERVVGVTFVTAVGNGRVQRMRWAWSKVLLENCTDERKKQQNIGVKEIMCFYNYTAIKYF